MSTTPSKMAMPHARKCTMSPIMGGYWTNNIIIIIIIIILRPFITTRLSSSCLREHSWMLSHYGGQVTAVCHECAKPWSGSWQGRTKWSTQQIPRNLSRLFEKTFENMPFIQRNLKKLDSATLSMLWILNHPKQSHKTICPQTAIHIKFTKKCIN